MSLNIENFKLVRQHVEINPAFDMETYYHPCGTAACIVGSASVLARQINNLTGPIATQAVVSDFLGLTDIYNEDFDEFELAFLQHGKWSPNGMRASKAEALLYLDKVIETGDIFQTVSIYELDGA